MREKPDQFDPDHDPDQFDLRYLLGFEALILASSTPPVVAQYVAGRRRIAGLKFRPPQASKANLCLSTSNQILWQI